MKKQSIACVAPFLRYPAAVALLLAALPAVKAADYYWNTTSNTTWTTTTAWSNNPASGGTTGTVPTSSDNATFNQSSVNGNEIVSLSAATSINGITFNNTGTTTIQKTTATGSFDITIGAGGITMGAAAGNVTFSTGNRVNAVIGANQTWTNNNAAATISGFNGFTLSGNSLTLAGAGNFNVSASIVSTAPAILNADQSGAYTIGHSNGNSNFLGTFNIGLNGGKVLLGPSTTGFFNNAALVNIKGGTLASLSGAPKSLNSATVYVTGNFTLGQAVTGTGAVTILGAMDLNGATREITIANAADTISGNITNGALTKVGTGTLTFNGTGANTYTGLTTVSAGGLTLSKTSVNAIAGNVIVNNTGTLTLGAADQIINTSNVEVATGGTFALGANNETVNGVKLTGGAISGSGVLTSSTAFDLQSGSSAAVLAGAVAANKTTSGTVTLSGNNTYTGATTVDAGTLIVSGAIASSVTTVAPGAMLTFTGSSSAGNITVGSGASVALGSAGTAGSVTINGGTFTGAGTVDSLTFTGASVFAPGNSPGTVTIADGGTLTMSVNTVSDFEITDPLFGAGTYDLVRGTTGGASESVVLNGTLNLIFSGISYSASATAVRIFEVDSFSGAFSSVNVSGLDAGLVATFDSNTGYVAIAAIPEPSASAVLACFVMIGFTLHRRRRRQKAAVVA